ncbi:MAG: bifunctional serine/threonine-protein kinase/formylglycine-generating enzyme family protein [Terriglobia bacterium]
MRTCPKCQRTYPDDADFCLKDGTPLPSASSVTESELASGLARRYRIVKKLGAGGMGAVFLAEQIALGNRPVALKVLSRRLLDDPEFLLRFHDEGASTARIRHANVVTIYESGQSDDGTPYIAMEYLEGETLRQTLRTRGALPVAECAEILPQIARGLNAAHKLGIIHRDLKPDNIFLTYPDDVGATLVVAPGRAQGPPLQPVMVKLVDFGIAKLRESASRTLTGTVLGTPAYMSCEQASGMRSDQLDGRSDIYSLGVVSYEMLTGRVPFHSDTPLGYVRKHMLEEPPPFRAVAPGLPVSPQVEATVMKALAKDREQRYPSTLDFARDFARAASSQSEAESPVPLATTKLIEHRIPVPESRGLREAEAPVSPAASVGRKPEPPVKTPLPRHESLDRAGMSVARYAYVGLGALIILVAAGAIWYFSHSAKQQPQKQQAPPRPASSAPPGMVYVPGGTFTMGRDNAPNPEETPAHSVTVAPFYIGKEPVTQAQYSEFLQKSKGESSIYPDSQAAWPATNISWQDAQAYCGGAVPGARLPSEAEWEFAARGTDGRLYPWGNSFTSALVDSLEAGLDHPEPVGIRPKNASPFGVLDMSGNVWQWCFDDYKPYDPFASLSSSHIIPEDAKVIRGGSFKSDADHVRTTTRNLDHATTRSPAIGFRCAKSP